MPSSPIAVRPCPLCKSPSTRSRGPILHAQPAFVAGVAIDLGAQAFALGQCKVCGFEFKHPAITEQALFECYARSAPDHWGERPDPIPRSLDRLRDIVTRVAPEGELLDIGCFNGGVLEYMGERWRRYGVEPSREAARVARSRGVEILGETLDDIAPDQRFDAIMALDVIEHVLDPLPFFRAVRARLKPGGVFLIQTGDVDAWTWRLEGSRYWYCSLPEHVSFFGRKSLRWIAREVGLEFVDHWRMPHYRQPPRLQALELLKNVGYIAGLRARGLGVPALRRLFVERRAPGWMSASDHMLHVLRTARGDWDDRAHAG